MFKVKAKNGYWDIVVGQYLAYLIPPFCYVVIGLTLYIFWKIGGLSLLQQKMYFKSAVVLFDFLLFELFFFFVITLIIVAVNKWTGRNRITNLDHEFEFTEVDYTGHTAESEYKSLLKNVARFAETPKRIMWYNKNNTIENYPKSCFNAEDLRNLRNFFESKHSRYLEWACRFGVYLYLFFILILAGFLFYPRYSLMRTPGQLRAFSTDGETLVDFMMSDTGRVERLVDEVHPYLRFLTGKPVYSNAFVHEMYLLKDGKARVLPPMRLYRTEGMLVAVGDDLYFTIHGKGREECLKFAGDSFQPFDCKQIEVYRRSCEDTGYPKPKWKEFSRWDEGTEEEENPQSAQTYVATFNPQNKPIQVEWDKPAENPASMNPETVYRWKSTEGTGVLEDNTLAPQYISRSKYLELFPKESNYPMEEEGGNP